MWVALRPEKLRIGYAPPAGPHENCAAGKVAHIGYRGDFSIYKVQLDSGLAMKAAIANTTRATEHPIGVGDRVWLTWAPEAGMVLTR